MARILVTGEDELAVALRGAGHEVVSHNGSALDLAVVRGLEPLHGTPTTSCWTRRDTGVTRAGIPIEPTGTEFDLLRYFLEHP